MYENENTSLRLRRTMIEFTFMEVPGETEDKMMADSKMCFVIFTKFPKIWLFEENQNNSDEGTSKRTETSPGRWHWRVDTEFMCRTDWMRIAEELLGFTRKSIESVVVDSSIGVFVLGINETESLETSGNSTSFENKRN
jgi:hypothetical protein